MSTVAGTALRGIVGLIVLSAMFLAIWVARHSNVHTGVATTEMEAESAALYPARAHRDPVTRSSIAPERKVRAASVH